MAAFISYPNEERLAMTGDEDVGFVVDCDAIFGENGDSAIVSSFANTHEGSGKVIKGVSS